MKQCSVYASTGATMERVVLDTCYGWRCTYSTFAFWRSWLEELHANNISRSSKHWLLRKNERSSRWSLGIQRILQCTTLVREYNKRFILTWLSTRVLYSRSGWWKKTRFVFRRSDDMGYVLPWPLLETLGRDKNNHSNFGVSNHCKRPAAAVRVLTSCARAV